LLIINKEVKPDIALVLQVLDRAANGDQKQSPDHTVAGVFSSMAIIMELVLVRIASARLDMKLN